MNDILIKGMEMPKNCSGCPLNYDQMMCIVTGTRWWSDTMVLMDFDSDKERLSDCPLVEIPTPHGRLKDVDRIEYENVYFEDVGESYEIVGKDDIDELPTVIEAEGSES